MSQSRTTQITIKKVAQGKYEAHKNGEKVATAVFTPKYYPAPYLPRGFQLTIRVKGRPTIKQVVKSVMEGRRKLLGTVDGK